MHASIVLTTFFSVAALATPLPQFIPIPGRDALLAAASAWRDDTEGVSTLLALASQQGVGAPGVVNGGGQAALDQENNELTHKTILDIFFSFNPSDKIAGASAALTSGSFQKVVDGLQDFASNGASAQTDPTLLAQDRCRDVLPNIDIYFQEVARVTQTEPLKAVRPQGVEGC
jgi:hypothetical protein